MFTASSSEMGCRITELLSTFYYLFFLNKLCYSNSCRIQPVCGSYTMTVILKQLHHDATLLPIIFDHQFKQFTGHKSPLELSKVASDPDESE